MENKIDVDALLKQITDTMKDFVETDLNIVGDLSDETGISRRTILKILYSDSISPNNIIRLYNTIQRRIATKNEEIKTKLNSEEAQALLNLQLKEVKEYLQVHPNDVGDLSDKAKIPVEEVLQTVYSSGSLTERVMQLYNAVQEIINEKMEEIKARNILSMEAEAILKKKLDDIKDFVKPNPNIVIDLSNESGLPTEVIFQTVYTNNKLPLNELGHLHSAVEKIKGIKSQEIQDRNSGL